VRNYTKELEKKGAERKRLTEQLQSMLYDVAVKIADTVPLEAIVKVDGITYKTVRHCSNLDCFDTVGIVTEDPFYGGAEVVRVIDSGHEPGTSYYLHRDFNCKVPVATRQQFLNFANSLPEIVRAFEAKEDEIINSLQDAFAKLRKLAEQ